MSTELVQLKPEQQIVEGGAAIDFTSKLFRLKPATLSVNQNSTQADGALPGKFRINETGEQFDRMTVVMLVTPKESRKWYMGEKGTLYRVPENLMCFAKEPEHGQPWQPDSRSKMPQAVYCHSCPKANDVQANWAKYKETGDRKDIPDCDREYFAVFVDTVTQMPLKMYVNSTHRNAFEEGTQVIARKIRHLQSQGLKPNLFDIQFDIYVEKKQNKNGKPASYVLKIDGKSVKLVSEKEKEAFGGMYVDYVNRGTEMSLNEEQASVEAADVEINKAVEGELVNEKGEVVI
jgi:hypothetical protein